MNKILLKIGGGFHLFCAALHVCFPSMFKWSERIAPLSGEDALVISANLSIMNYCLLVFWVILAYIPLLYAEEMLETKLGKALLTGIVLFWAVRIFVLQPLYVGFEGPESLVTVAVFLAGIALFAIPWARTVLLPRLIRK
ncbi:MAG: hypothetical protein JXA07_01120 [Spirochaetes bacterium]|nr:hypothetical protein [Spirochaetota bacterium]